MVITDDVEPSVAVALLSRAREGDAQAFCSLIQPLQTRLLRQAVALAGDLTAAEDLVSETLVEAWKSLRHYDETCRLSTWLYAILLHRHRKSERRARSRPISSARFTTSEAEALQQTQHQVPSPEASPAEAAAQGETFFQIMRCVELLPDRHRRVILLRFFEDASLSEISAVLGCSVGTVKSRLHHALGKLRQMKMNFPEMKGDKRT